MRQSKQQLSYVAPVITARQVNLKGYLLQNPRASSLPVAVQKLAKTEAGPTPPPTTTTVHFSLFTQTFVFYSSSQASKSTSVIKIQIETFFSSHIISSARLSDRAHP